MKTLQQFLREEDFFDRKQRIKKEDARAAALQPLVKKEIEKVLSNNGISSFLKKKYQQDFSYTVKWEVKPNKPSVSFRATFLSDDKLVKVEVDVYVGFSSATTSIETPLPKPDKILYQIVLNTNVSENKRVVSYKNNEFYQDTGMMNFKKSILSPEKIF